MPKTRTQIDYPALDDFEPYREKVLHSMKLAHFFETPYIRIFSYYMPEGKDPAAFRDEVIRRMREKTKMAEAEDVVLLHENESDIFGDTGERCEDIFRSVVSPNLRSAFDFANFVNVGEDPIRAWSRMKPCTVCFHIKDYSRAEGKVVVAGKGDGRVSDILADAFASGYDGPLTLEPHLAVAGRAGGFTGPELYKQARDALVAILDDLGVSYA